jgi:hypothetical protein
MTDKYNQLLDEWVEECKKQKLTSLVLPCFPERNPLAYCPKCSPDGGNRRWYGGSRRYDESVEHKLFLNGKVWTVFVPSCLGSSYRDYVIIEMCLEVVGEISGEKLVTEQMLIADRTMLLDGGRKTPPVFSYEYRGKQIDYWRMKVLEPYIVKKNSRWQTQDDLYHLYSKVLYPMNHVVPEYSHPFIRPQRFDLFDYTLNRAVEYYGEGHYQENW